MKRLLLIASEFPPGPGGIGTHAYQLCLHLTRLGWEVHVLTIQDYASPQEAAAFNHVQDFKVTQFQRKKNRINDQKERWQRVRKVLKNWQPDVLMVTGDYQVWLAALLQVFENLVARKNFTPWCAVWHGVIPPRSISRQLTAWAFSQPDLTITVSKYSKGQLIAMGTRPRKSLVITNGADEKKYSPDPAAGNSLRKSLGLTNARILLTVGHVSERKGQDIVIRALPEILKTIPNVHYLIVGLPSLQAHLEKLAEDLGVASHVYFTGRIAPDMLNAAFNACDLFVLTSRHSSNGEFEGYGIVAVEAALCAKPSVVAGNSGLSEAVLDGQTGIVVPENDPQATAQAIKKLLQDGSLLKSMGQQARQRALTEQTWSASMAQYDQALSELLK